MLAPPPQPEAGQPGGTRAAPGIRHLPGHRDRLMLDWDVSPWVSVRITHSGGTRVRHGSRMVVLVLPTVLSGGPAWAHGHQKGCGVAFIKSVKIEECHVMIMTPFLSPVCQILQNVITLLLM